MSNYGSGIFRYIATTRHAIILTLISRRFIFKKPLDGHFSWLRYVKKISVQKAQIALFVVITSRLSILQLSWLSIQN